MQFKKKMKRVFSKMSKVQLDFFKIFDCLIIKFPVLKTVQFNLRGLNFYLKKIKKNYG